MLKLPRKLWEQWGRYLEFRVGDLTDLCNDLKILNILRFDNIYKFLECPCYRCVMLVRWSLTWCSHFNLHFINSTKGAFFWKNFKRYIILVPHFLSVICRNRNCIQPIERLNGSESMKRYVKESLQSTRKSYNSTLQPMA